MKKSEVYKKAMAAVVNCDFLSVDAKIEILKELIERETTAIYMETREETESGVENDG